MPENKENTTSNQEVTPEAYAALQASLEAEKASAIKAVEQATQPLKERIASLEADVKAKGEEVAKTIAIVAEKDKGFASLSQNFESTVTAYKGQVLKANPLVPPELIQGSSVTEVDQALEKANGIVNKVKETIAQQNQQTVIPPGAPGRTEPDLSSLTTKEKITKGLEARKQQQKK